MSSCVETFVADCIGFGEGPRYRDGHLYISDMVQGRIYTINVQTLEKKVLIEVEGRPNGMDFHPDGSLVYTSMFDCRIHRFHHGKSDFYVDLSSTMTGY